MRIKNFRIIRSILLILIPALGLAACTMSSAEADESSRQTSVALTVEAALPTEDLSDPTATITPETEATDDPGEGLPRPTFTSNPDETQTEGDEEEEIGDDRAEFIADVTIPDYSQHLQGDEITKTWRVRNTGTTTWTTDYYLEFQKGERLGAPDQINLTESVAPNDFIDLSIDFTVPNATGEYSSYWELKNEDGQHVGVEEEGKFLTLFMIIRSVGEDPGDGDGGDGGNGSSGGISGGAKITNATVSVDDANYSGSCPEGITFTYTVTTSNAGRVVFYLELNAISPSGYNFDPTPEYDIDFNSGYTVTYQYTLFSNSSVSATARVVAVGENTFNSSRVNFSINCN